MNPFLAKLLWVVVFYHSNRSPKEDSYVPLRHTTWYTVVLARLEPILKGSAYFVLRTVNAAAKGSELKADEAGRPPRLSAAF